MSDPFYTFIAWVKLDARMAQHEARIARLSRDLEALEVGGQASKQAHDTAHREVVQAKKLVDQQELAIRVLRDREKKITAQRDTSNSSKEYVSLDAQIKVIAAELDQHENTLFELFEAYETLQKAYAEHELVYTSQQADVAQRKAVSEQAIQHEREALTVLAPEYDTLKSHVSQEFLTLFLDRKKQVPNPVVPVSTTSSCSACSYMIVAHDMVRLRKHAIIPCQQCYRLLYMSEEL